MTVEITEQPGPVLFITYQQRVEDGDLQAAIDAVDTWVARREPFGIVVNTLSSEPMNSQQRKVMAEALERNATPLIRGCGVAISSPLIRGVFTALTWISPPQFPTRVFPRVEEAEAWVRAQLQ